jgi:hypothetical protein
MRNGATRIGTLATRTGKIGAGGFTTGLSFAADGTKMVRTDTFDAYVGAPGITPVWAHQLKPGTSVTASQIDLFYGSSPHPWGQCGTYDAVIAPSNSAVRYIVCMGYVWVTQDSGATYTRCALAQKANCFPNEANRMSGRPLAVDPQNPAVVYFGAPDALHWSDNYGTSWTSVSTGTIPAPTSGRRMCVAFDPNSSVVSTKKQGIYVFVNGSGLYRSTNGGTSWTAVSGSPTAASHCKVGSNGYVYLAGNGEADTGQFRRWVPSGPTWIAPTGINAKSIAISPHNAGHIYLTQGGGGLDVSTDYGVTWSLGGGNTTTNSRSSVNIGWQAWTNENYMTNGDIEFDPLVNRIWCAEGIGVWYTNSPPTTFTFGNSTSWVECSNGIENMVTSTLTTAPDGKVGYACHDRGTFIIAKSAAGVTFPAKHGLSTAFQHSQACDYAPEDTNFWVASSMQGSGTPVSVVGYTTDMGATWTQVSGLDATAAGNGGGQIAVLSKDVWIVAPVGAGKGVWLTVNRGANWTQLTIGDNAALLVQQAYNYSRKVLIKDAYTAGRCYLYHVGNPDSNTASDIACRGIWRIDVNLGNGTPTVTRVTTSYITAPGGYGGPDFYHGKLAQISATEWLWCGGDSCLGLWRSTDSMATWAQVTGSDDVNGAAGFGEVFGVGVGKAASGSSYKTLLAAGWRQVTPVDASTATGYGFWISYDNGANWTRVAQYADGIFDIVNDIVGDLSTFGRFYIGWGGTGMSMLNYDYSLRMS